ncbi:DUF5996 family protein [Ramlibacter tataouinensis]|uniref:DUF5996 family protein n=1 Tax=Ramlibacter tataouinensis TaxID=94132 RepID=UPI0022F3996D|nr:DUF5996 family protein [Ramlibacter tataouinensis]WBY01179.1 DUF5996 family protein [Ramlibacter tataouinensis]
MSSSESARTRAADWPDLPLAGWRDTAATLHMWTQIVGKTRLALAPRQNHWWHTTLYVTERGLTTSAMHGGDRMLSVEFDFIAHALNLRTGDGDSHTLALVPQTVTDFHARYLAALRSLDIVPAIMGRPVEVATAIPFADDVQHAAYDAAAVRRWWQVLARIDGVFKRFRGDFAGKQSPVHFFWGSFDLAVTRFSGRRAPLHPGGAPNCPDYVMHEAYSHECSSAGFWPGGGYVDEPAFYAYAYPEPTGYAQHAIAPAAAYYHPTAHEFILPYEAVRHAADPEADLLAFLRSSYDAAATLGHWDREALAPYVA